MKLPLREQYSKLLGLVINTKLRINDFTGNVKELENIIVKIKEAI